MKRICAKSKKRWHERIIHKLIAGIHIIIIYELDVLCVVDAEYARDIDGTLDIMRRTAHSHLSK